MASFNVVDVFDGVTMQVQIKQTLHAAEVHELNLVQLSVEINHNYHK